MRKTITIAMLIVTFLIIYFLQVNFFNWFTIAGVMPNLFIILILVIGLFTGRAIGITVGIIAGILLDFFIGKSIGISSIMFGIIGFIGGYLDKSFSKDSRITIILMVILATFVFEVGKYAINIMLYKIPIEMLPFLRLLIVEIIYNVILTIILYPLIKKTGYYMENVFRSKNILTRYF